MVTIRFLVRSRAFGLGDWTDRRLGRFGGGRGVRTLGRMQLDPSQRSYSGDGGVGERAPRRVARRSACPAGPGSGRDPSAPPIANRHPRPVRYSSVSPSCRLDKRPLQSHDQRHERDGRADEVPLHVCRRSQIGAEIVERGHSSRIRPSTMRHTVIPRTSTCAPVAGRPPYPPSVCVPRNVQTAVTRSPSATSKSTLILRSGNACFSAWTASWSSESP